MGTNQSWKFDVAEYKCASRQLLLDGHPRQDCAAQFVADQRLGERHAVDFGDDVQIDAALISRFR
jgi:hypothetical protein